MPQRSSGKPNETPVGGIEYVGPIDTTDTRRRCRREALLPGAGRQVAGKRVKALRNAVVTRVMNPLIRVRIKIAAALIEESRRGRAFTRAALDPYVLRMIRPGRHVS